jgi:hypothetical protein
VLPTVAGLRICVLGPPVDNHTCAYYWPWKNRLRKGLIANSLISSFFDRCRVSRVARRQVSEAERFDRKLAVSDYFQWLDRDDISGALIL